MDVEEEPQSPRVLSFQIEGGVCSEGGWISLFLGNRIKCCEFVDYEHQWVVNCGPLATSDVPAV